MNHYEFTLHLDREPNDDEIDALYEAGFDDSGIGGGKGHGHIAIEREAKSISDAVRLAVAQARSAGFEVIAVNEEDLVSRATIATRLGVSIEYVRLLANGNRGPGGFPIAESGDGWSLYSWAEVSRWANQNLHAKVIEDDEMRVLSIADHLLRARSMSRKEDQKMMAELVAA